LTTAQQPIRESNPVRRGSQNESAQHGALRKGDASAMRLLHCAVVKKQGIYQITGMPHKESRPDRYPDGRLPGDDVFYVMTGAELSSSCDDRQRDSSTSCRFAIMVPPPSGCFNVENNYAYSNEQRQSHLSRPGDVALLVWTT
jgi:hypothetical protein